MEDKEGNVAASAGHNIGALATAIARLAQNDGDYATAIPWLSLHRRTSPSAPLPCIYACGLGVIAQGEKQVMLGEEMFHYGAGRTMLATIDLPVVSNVARASAVQPFLGLMVLLDPRLVLQVAAEFPAAAPARDGDSSSLSVGELERPLLDALLRLIDLLDEPAVLPQLAPLVQRELVVRLLAGPDGPKLRRMVADGSPSRKIAAAVSWLKQNIASPLQSDALAAGAHMSASTFRHHFRAITGMSPLQYQKQLRLQEARQLMLTQNVDAGSAGVQVGYESASQFSREYARLFGSPPLRDIQRLRQGA
jgi:AraC-like DNA-binding protein